MKNDTDETVRWRLLVNAAKQAVEEQGYTLAKMPGRGLSNIWKITKGGKSQIASIRTTRDRWFAFPPLDSGTKWRTLDEVDVVVVAAVDSKEKPQHVQVYMFPANKVRERFNAAFAARSQEGQVNKDGFGMWVNLDLDTRGIAASVGSGIVKQYKPLATYSIADLINTHPVDLSVQEGEEISPGTTEPANSTIAEVMAWARKRVAEIAGVGVESVKLDLRVEY